METFYKTFLSQKSLRLREGARTWSFADLCELTQSAECKLKEIGAKPGEILTLKNTNHAMHIALLFACENLQLIFAPFYEGLTEAEWQNQLKKLNPEWCATIEDGSLKIKRLRLATGSRDRAGIIFQTSGTTGTPGFIFKSFENLFMNAMLSVRGQKFSENSNIGSILSFSHVGGLCIQATGGILAGSMLTLIDRYKLKNFSEQLKVFTHAIIVPSYYQLLKNENTFAKINYKHQPLVVTGSTAVVPQVFIGLEKKGFRVQSVYGLTEIGPYVCIQENSRLSLSEQALSILGKPIAEYRMRINSETSEIEVSGPCAGQKYEPEGERFYPLVNNEGYLATGDQGFESNGLFYFKGRIKNLIVVGGFKVNPLEIEQTLMQLPFVQNCTVVGKPHEILGEIPVAYIIGDQKQNDAITKHLKENLSSQKIPRKLYFVEALPETSIGKAHLPEIRKKFL